MGQYSRVYAKIDLDAIAANMGQMKRHIGEGVRMIAVIKADGYGHGALPIAAMFEKTPYVWGYAVACLEEALELVRAGMKKPVLVLGCVFPDGYEEMICHGIRAAVYTPEMARKMSETAQRLERQAYLHIKLDTGMGRIGFPVTEQSAEMIAEICRLPHISAEGLFTHFARADEHDKAFTCLQYERFLHMKEMLAKRNIMFPLLHCDNSAGIIDFPEAGHDLVRAGIAMYGIYPSDEVCKTAVPLRPALSLVSHITYVKEVGPGTPVSYGGTFVAPGKMRIATIPVGYGDGYPRSLSNKGAVLIRGKRAPIVGRICMDQFMVDVTEIPEASIMDRVVLIGQDGAEKIPIEELSSLSGRFPYEFICCLGKRIPRIYG